MRCDARPAAVTVSLYAKAAVSSSAKLPGFFVETRRGESSETIRARGASAAAALGRGGESIGSSRRGMVRGRVAAPPRLPRGYSAEVCRLGGVAMMPRAEPPPPRSPAD